MARPRIEEMSLEMSRRCSIKKALARFNGNVSHAANALGLSRQRPLPAFATIRIVHPGNTPCPLPRKSARLSHEGRVVLLACWPGCRVRPAL